MKAALLRNLFFVGALLGISFGFLESQPAWSEPLRASEKNSGKGSELSPQLNAKSITKFRSLVPQEIGELIAQGKFTVTLGTEDQSAEISASSQSVWSRIPEEIRKELKIENGANPDQTGKRGAKFLRASEVLLAGEGAIDASVRVRILDSKRKVEASLKLKRRYPATLGYEAPAKQFFMERIDLISPVVWSKLRWLSFRFAGEDEDAVWITSPVLGTVREAAGINRSDPMLAHFPAADDLLGFSMKNELLFVQINAPTQVLGLFEAPRLVLPETGGIDPLEPEKKIVSKVCETASPPRDLNSPEAEQSFFGVMRKVFRLEIVSRDPFLSQRRQTLWLDAESLLPLYRITYDSSGRVSRIFATVFATASQRTARLLPVTTFQFEPSSGSRAEIFYSNYRLCSVLPQEDFFSPTAMLKEMP